MGKANGSKVMQDIIAGIQLAFPRQVRTRFTIYCSVIKALDGNDWDTRDECLGIDMAFDLALNDIHPGGLNNECV